MPDSSFRSTCSRAAAVAFTLAIAPGVLAAQSMVAAGPVMPVAQQVASAVLPLPQEMRDSAGVLGYRANGGRLEVLRPAKNGMMCLADDPGDDRFHVACYHESMDPFMARGRVLREQGVKGTSVDSVRYADVKSGRIRMPAFPASLYQMTGPKDGYDPATNSVPKATGSLVVYVPNATEASTGLSAKPSATAPWLMFPGTPKAHIMFSLRM